MRILLVAIVLCMVCFYPAMSQVLPSPIEIEQLGTKVGASDAQIQQAIDAVKNSKQTSPSQQSSGSNTNSGSQPKVSNPSGLENKTTDSQGNSKDNTKGTGSDEKKDQKADEPKKIESELDKKQKQDFGENYVYGKLLFQNNNIKFYDKASEVIAPDNYKLGAGDELNVSVWGYSDYSELYHVNELGYIESKQIGRIYLKGLTFAKAKSLISSKLAEIFDLQNSQHDITLSYVRVITVNIVGEVENPGSYTIPAINTAFNALVVTGGPNKIGSVRNIYLKRQGVTIDTLDVYKFLMDPSYYQDLFLQNNDYIFIPPMKRFATIKGEVKRPFIYELRENENLNEIIKFAGGLNATAYTSNVQIKRILNNKEILIDLNIDSLKKINKNFKLQDEDEIQINRVPKGIINMVSLSGAVKLPGDYEFRPGDRVSDLLKKAEGPMFDAFLEKGYIMRTKDDLKKEFIAINLSEIIKNPNSPDNIVLHPFDNIKLLSKASFSDVLSFEVQGSVRLPGRQDLGGGLTIRDALALAGGVTLDAYTQRAYILREEKNFFQKYISVNLDNVIKDEKSADNIVLLNNDIIKVMSQREFSDKYTVTVGGAVKNKAVFPFGNGMTLKDALLMAGGLLPEAANNKIEIARAVNASDSALIGGGAIKNIISLQIKKDLSLDKITENFLLRPSDEIYVRVDPFFQEANHVYLKGEVLYPGQYTMIAKDERVRDLINRAGGLTKYAFIEGAYVNREAYGHIGLDLKKVMEKKNKTYNFILEKGDTIILPHTVELVHVSGSVGNTIDGIINTPFFGKRAGFYIREFAGGFSDSASKKGVYVRYPNGIFKKTKSLFFIHLYPKVKKNASIYVPKNKKKIKKENNQSKPVDWNDMIEKTSVKITGIISLLLLIRAFAK